MIVYLIHAHKDVTQLNTLIAYLASSETVIYVHLDKKWQLDLSLVSSQARLVEPRVDVKWGDWSQVEATLNSLTAIEREGLLYQHLVFISAQDFPLYPSTELANRMLANTDYISVQEISPQGWNCQSRYEAYHYHGNTAFLRYSYALLNKLGIKRRLPYHLKAYGGSSWWSLTQTTVRSVLDYVASHPKISKFFATTQCPDEFFFQTIIFNLALVSRHENTNLRFIKFIEGKSNPEILLSSDLSEILASKALFARKMDQQLSAALIEQLQQKRNLTTGS